MQKLMNKMSTFYLKTGSKPVLPGPAHLPDLCPSPGSRPGMQSELV